MRLAIFVLWTLLSATSAMGQVSVGIALPGAIGAKLIYPDRRVLAECGDGGFLMSAQELATAVRAELNDVN